MTQKKKKKKRGNQKLQAWIDARKQFHLSHAQVQMARELGLNPKKLGKLDNHDQEPWKLPLRQYIEALYFKRFGRERPEVVKSIEEKEWEKKEKKERRREEKLKKKEMETNGNDPGIPEDEEK